MSGTEIHMYLGELEPGSVIHIHAGREPDSAPSAPRRQNVETMTERLTAYANGANTLAVIDGVRTLGCTLKAPDVRSRGNRPQVYLLVYAPASPGGAMFYLYPQSAQFYRTADRDVLVTMDGAQDRGSYIAFDTTTPEGVQHVLAAIQAVLRTRGASGR